MNYTLKICTILLLAALLVGCQSAPAPTETTVVTQPTETTVATEAATAIVTEEALVDALENAYWVTMEGDITLTSGAPMRDRILDGGGYTLTAPVYVEDDPSTSCGVLIIKGTVKNITVKGGYRGIGTSKDFRSSGDIRLTNVIAEGENCALYIGHGNNSGAVNATDCEFYGQTVFNKVQYAMFENCTFGFNDSGSRGNITAYANTTLVGCHFQGLEDKLYTIAFSKNVDSFTMILEDCYVGDTLITQENIEQLLKVKPYSNTIQVRNTVED